MSYVPPEAVPICAADGTGVEDLLHVLDAVIGAQLDKQRRTVKFPQELMPQVMAFLHKNGAVDQESLSIEEDGDSTTAQVWYKQNLRMQPKSVCPTSKQLQNGRCALMPFCPPLAGSAGKQSGEIFNRPENFHAACLLYLCILALVTIVTCRHC
ncbi:hflX [Symbiodinium necroappetens]|uniref:HflX protein n=1 Tax=Symbiodinium necroappetens TaxID=1628268 RepID=A0A813A127_9DINO|nr:hflX [Symbiodinium necroappetens]